MKTKQFHFTPYQIFYVLYGLFFPVSVLGAIIISYMQHPAFGLLTAVIFFSWVWHSFSTTCSRCQFYGTNKCGIPGIVVPYFFKKRSLVGFPLWRIKANYYSDIGLMIYLNLVYSLHPPLLRITLTINLIVWFVVYRKKRFHGLMYLLKKEKKIPIRLVSSFEER